MRCPRRLPSALQGAGLSGSAAACEGHSRGGGGEGGSRCGSPQFSGTRTRGAPVPTRNPPAEGEAAPGDPALGSSRGFLGAGGALRGRNPPRREAAAPTGSLSFPRQVLQHRAREEHVRPRRLRLLPGPAPLRPAPRAPSTAPAAARAPLGGQNKSFEPRTRLVGVSGEGRQAWSPGPAPGSPEGARRHFRAPGRGLRGPIGRLRAGKARRPKPPPGWRPFRATTCASSCSATRPGAPSARAQSPGRGPRE